MRIHPPHVLLRLAVVLLLALNVVPEALAALPLCGKDFGPAHVTAPVAPKTLRHSHDAKALHECVATMPGKQAEAHVTPAAPDHVVAVLPVIAHPARMLAARGPSPRGSPAQANAWLTQRSSVLLLI